MTQRGPSCASCQAVSVRDAAVRQIYRVGFWVLWAAAYLTRPHNHGVKGVLANGGEVLLVRHTYGFKEWELPGGGQRRRESARDALQRELREELGVTVSSASELGTFNGPRQYRNTLVTYFLAELPDRALTPDPVEIAEVAWCDPASPPRPLGWFAAEALARAAETIALD